MRRNSSFKGFVIILFAGFLMTSQLIFAENDSGLNGKPENERKMPILSRIKSFTQNPHKRNEINDKNKNSRVVSSTQKRTTSTNNVTPLTIIIKSITGEEENDRYAVIEFEGKEITVRKDQIVENKFKVIDIYPDRMVVYSPKEQRRRTYKLIKEETENSTK